MGERDAFGREKGEDTLAGLGWTSGDPLPPPSEPILEEPRAPEAAPVAVAPPTTPRTSTAFRFDAPVAVPTRRRTSGCGLALTVALLLGVGTVVGGVSLVADGIQDAEEAVDALPSLTPKPATPDVGEAPRATTPPVGLKRGSLLLRTNFRRALAAVRAREAGQLRSLRVEPQRLDLQLRTKDGRLKSVQYRWTGEVERLSRSGPGFGFVTTVPFARIDTRAPSRAVAAAAGRLQTGAARVNYLVYTGGLSGWSVFFQGGQHFRADDRGRIVRRVS